MPNRFGIDYAHPGLCSLCHEEIAEFQGSRQVSQGVSRPIIKRILGIARLIEVKLDDKSKMSVAMCKKCESKLEPKDMQELMESEINGWQREIDDIVTKFTDVEKKKYMNQYSRRYVVARVDKRWTPDENKKIKKPRKSKLKVRTK